LPISVQLFFSRYLTKIEVRKHPKQQVETMPVDFQAELKELKEEKKQLNADLQAATDKEEKIVIRQQLTANVTSQSKVLERLPANEVSSDDEYPSFFFSGETITFTKATLPEFSFLGQVASTTIPTDRKGSAFVIPEGHGITMECLRQVKEALLNKKCKVHSKYAEPIKYLMLESNVAFGSDIASDVASTMVGGEDSPFMVFSFLITTSDQEARVIVAKTAADVTRMDGFTRFRGTVEWVLVSAHPDRIRCVVALPSEVALARPQWIDEVKEMFFKALKVESPDLCDVSPIAPSSRLKRGFHLSGDPRRDANMTQEKLMPSTPSFDSFPIA
jgi:hypothetical protein